MDTWKQKILHIIKHPPESWKSFPSPDREDTYIRVNDRGLESNFIRYKKIETKCETTFETKYETTFETKYVKVQETIRKCTYPITDLMYNRALKNDKIIDTYFLKAIEYFKTSKISECTIVWSKLGDILSMTFSNDYKMGGEYLNSSGFYANNLTLSYYVSIPKYENMMYENMMYGNMIKEKILEKYSVHDENLRFAPYKMNITSSDEGITHIVRDYGYIDTLLC